MYGLKAAIKKFFADSKHEIESSSRLRRYGFALSLIHIFTFASWFFHLNVYNFISAGSPAICQPFLQFCTAFRFGSPEAWRWILVGYFILALIGCWTWVKAPLKWSLSFTWLLLVLKFFIYAQDYRLMGNYHYIHFVFLLLFLLLPRKEQILPYALVLVYVGAGLLKLNWEWISGSALYDDLGVLSFIPLQWATIYVIVLELGFSWLLVSRNSKLRWFALSQFIFFHLYSIQIVGLLYPAVMFCVLSILIIKPAQNPSGWKSLWRTHSHRYVIVFFMIAQIYPALVPGNSAITGEGRLIALNMFDARAECKHTFLIEHTSKLFEQRNFDLKKFGVRIRCEPYVYLEMARRICEGKRVEAGRVDLLLDAKLSSEKNYSTLISEKDICRSALTFNPLWKNKWIKREDLTSSPWKTWHIKDAKISPEAPVIQYRNNSHRTGVVTAAEFPHPMSRPFWRKLEWNDNRHTASKSSPISDDNAIYVGSDQGVFAALNFDGKELWKWQLSSLQGVHGTAAIIGDAVYWGDYDGLFYSTDKKTGTLNWLIDLGDSIGSSPLVAKEADRFVIYIAVETADLNGYVVKLDAVSGKVLWQTERLGEHPHSSPALSEDGKLVFVGANNGKMSAFKTESGLESWHRVTGGPIKGTPMVAKDSVFFCSWDSSFYRLQASTGALIWKTPLAGRCQSSASWSSQSNSVFLNDSSGGTYGFHADTGKIKWAHQGVGNVLGSPVLLKKVNSEQEQLLGQCFVHALCLFNPKDGKILRRMPLGDRITSVPWIQNGEIIYTLDGPGGIVKWK